MARIALDQLRVVVVGRARIWNSRVASSYSWIVAPSAPASWAARDTIVFSTVSRSRVEVTACPTSPSARSSSTERVSWAVRASSSLNSRTFSIAITAWAAKVVTSLICASENGRAAGRQIVTAPIGIPSRSIGTASTVRWLRIDCGGMSVFRILRDVGDVDDPALQHGPAHCELAPRPSRKGRPHALDLRRCEAEARCERQELPLEAEQVTARRPRIDAPRFRTIVSKTGWTSVGELEMTRRISLVAVCCSRASVSSRFRASSSCEQPHVLDRDHRLVGEGLEPARSAFVKGCTSLRRMYDGADGHALPQERRGQHRPGWDMAPRVRASVSGNSVSGRAWKILDMDRSPITHHAPRHARSGSRRRSRRSALSPA